MKTRFTLAAELELDEAVAFYEQRAPGLGRQFLLEVANAVALIEEFPEAWPQVSDVDRACRVKRFPYRLVYFIDDRDIVVLAVAHFKRRLQYWRDRIRG
ncbi:MAG: type II toxin-antitoxin system RelE/ParE family toxin [Rhodomicrobium sp.]